MEAESAADTPKNAISINDGVVLRKGASLKFIKARPGIKERMVNFNFYVDKLIGKPFGSAFEVQRNQLIQTDPLKFEREEDDFNIEGQIRDNRDILDNSDSQKLSKDDIMKLKEEGTDRQEIIEKIVESSSTFKDKTSYSQAKYLRKKKKKHLAYFTTLKPTARLLCELYFTRATSKILEIRPDTLGQILTWSNIHFGSNVLVAETCQGLILGSVLERIGEQGCIVQAYNGSSPVRIILDQFNFPEGTKSKQICGFSLENLEVIKTDIANPGLSNEAGAEIVPVQDGNEEDCISEMLGVKMEGKHGLGEEISILKEKQTEKDECKGALDPLREEDHASMSIEGTDICSDDKDKVNTFSHTDYVDVPCNKFYTKEKRIAEEKCAKEMIKKKNLDALIIATKFHPLAILLELIEFIKPSAPIVIYCQYKEPLMECYRHLRDASFALNVNLTETWFRELQVLPNRTRPAITMSARSGYLLRALKIKNPGQGEKDFEPKAKLMKI